jgi:CBS domain-containing protein/nucleotide-binding universal stress UspA family protein
MFRHILVGLEGSEAARRALSAALRLAAQSGGEVWALSVEERLPVYAASVGEVDETKREMDAYFQKIHESAQAEAQAMNVRLHTVIVAGRAAETIVRYAHDGGFDLVVLGGANRGLGGTADKVVERAPCSVLVVRESPLSVWVEDIMTTDVATVELTSPLHNVVESLIRRGVKAVPVVDAEQHVVGIITGGDLLERGGLRHRLSLVKTLDAETITAQLNELAQSRQMAQDVMTPEPITISRRTPVSAAARLMAERRFKRLPVVGDDGKLLGVVARLDVLRVIAHAAPQGEVTAQVIVGGRLVREFMAASIPTVVPESPAADILARLAASPYRRVVVVDAQRQVLGLITDREVIQHVGPEVHAGFLRRLTGRTGPLGDITVSGRAADMMLRHVITVTDDAPIMDALRLMMANKIKRLPVVNGGGRLVGIVDRDAVLRAVVGEL